MSNASKRYTFSYVFEREEWAGEVWADSKEEAQRKVRAMSSGIVEGELMFDIRVPNFIGRIAEWLRGKQ